MKYIKNKYCKNNLVQLMHISNRCNFIVSPDEIILLKSDGNLILNSYKKHPKRFLFPYSINSVTNSNHSLYYNELFEYDKPYLNFSGEGVGGYSFQLNYFIKDDENKTIFYSTPISCDRRYASEKDIYLTEEELKKIFDKKSNDSIYVIDVYGKILFANNKVNGLVIKKNIVPNNKELIELDKQKREYDEDMKIMARRIAHCFDDDYKEEEKEKILPRNVDEIKDLDIFSAGLFNNYSHMLLTVKNGKFSLMWFKLKYLEKDKFKLTYHNIPITIPDKNEIINYVKENEIEIENISDPNITYVDEDLEKKRKTIKIKRN